MRWPRFQSWRVSVGSHGSATSRVGLLPVKVLAAMALKQRWSGLAAEVLEDG